MTGYETERQAADAARHIYDSPPAAWQDGNHRLLEGACRAAGVELGAYDHRILLWLAGWEPSTCAVAAGLIMRAWAGGVFDDDGRRTFLAALDDASDGIRDRAAYCPACAAHPAGLCDKCAGRLARAEAYDALAAKLREATQ